MPAPVRWCREVTHLGPPLRAGLTQYLSPQISKSHTFIFIPSILHLWWNKMSSISVLKSISLAAATIDRNVEPTNYSARLPPVQSECRRSGEGSSQELWSQFPLQFLPLHIVFHTQWISLPQSQYFYPQATLSGHLNLTKKVIQHLNGLNMLLDD